MSQSNYNPFESVGTLKTKEANDGIRERIKRIRDEINSNESGIIELAKEIENVEGLIEINSFYSNPETNDKFFIN